MTSKTPYLSIIIPAHNEERRLGNSLEKVAAFVQKQPFTTEIIVVENGSTDGTLELARRASRSIAGLTVIHENERGKGLAVRRGMLAATGTYRFFADADLSMPIAEVNRFLPPRLKEVELAIGSREAKGARRYNEPAYRNIAGRTFNLLVRLIVLPGLKDTQCGFKCFRGDIAEQVFSRQTFTGWSFDPEVLFIARQLGYHIREVPIPWYFNAESKVRLFHDSLGMMRDLFTIRRNAARGLYDRKID
jgi:dolichyl-phosphate beta-glucosyltransferase